MASWHRDVLVLAGLICFLIAGFLLHPILGIVILGIEFCLIALVLSFVLAPDLTDEDEGEADHGLG